MNKTVKQPLRGIYAITIVIIATMLLISLFSEPVFASWVSYLFMCCVPGQIILSLVWKCEYPKFLVHMTQPLKGLSLVALTALGGGIFAILGVFLVAKGVVPPGPQLNIFTIFLIVTMFWLVGVFQGEPFVSIIKNPLASGLSLLVVGYVIALTILYLGLDFRFMEEAPVYLPHMDGGGAFMAFDFLTFAITTVAMIMTCILFAFWPIVKIPMAQNKVVFMLSAVLYILVTSFAIRYVFVVILGMDQIVYMVMVPISFIFGTFILLDLFENKLFDGKPQPLKGCLYFILSILFGLTMYFLYWFLGPVISGKMIGGTPGYQLDFWIANAMLAISFPLIVVYNAFFNHWPFCNFSGDKTET